MRGTLTGQRFVDDILRPNVGPFLNGPHGQFYSKIMLIRIRQELLKTSSSLSDSSMSRPLPDLSTVERVGSAKTADAIVSLCT
ncbi:hypothetical protein TNCV_1169081 [Trichonephila clavipes]|uniref:Uncharacterized protein n=1 Tax=Trichonephila clavipes TaxID=2585209 RepID=A0A8X6SXD4_TRICX|nr:hypothetical protein TNCV_1169081 [Trichonephila clavipes]